MRCGRCRKGQWYSRSEQGPNPWRCSVRGSFVGLRDSDFWWIPGQAGVQPTGRGAYTSPGLVSHRAICVSLAPSCSIVFISSFWTRPLWAMLVCL